MLLIEQVPRVTDGLVHLSYAVSAPGVVAMSCGTKYARLAVYLEFWESEPPPPDERWEDSDEVSFAVVGGSTQLHVRGFESSEGDLLPIYGLDRARARVLARGRHRYTYGDLSPVEDLPPEEWLVQFWPDPQARDALAGPPRRIAGLLPFESRRSGWAAALDGWRPTGWQTTLHNIVAFRLIERALGRAGRPATVEELPGLWQGMEGPAILDWDSPVDAGPPRLPDDAARQAQLLALLSSAADMADITTFGDLLVAMERLGLLGRLGDDRLVPNAAPPLVWDALGMSEADAHIARVGVAWTRNATRKTMSCTSSAGPRTASSALLRYGWLCAWPVQRRKCSGR